ncbi:MAG: universal stress protein [Chloroflexi bacterium]|nr:universal stress protein [Chloroflexota bacterium]
MQITTLLVPHDGSWMADCALDYATILQGATGARLDVLSMAPDVVPEARAQPEVSIGDARNWHEWSRADPGADLSDPAALILDAIERRRPDLVVIASECWSPGGLSVDVTHHVARRSSSPILVIPTGVASPRRDFDVRRVLVALDGSEQAEQALTLARMLAEALDADMLLLRVVTPKVGGFNGQAPRDVLDLAAARRYVEKLARGLQTAQMWVSALAVVGEPGTMIAAVSRTQRASLLAMTTRGKAPLSSSELGGIAASSLRSATLPLLLVPPDVPVERAARPRASVSNG